MFRAWLLTLCCSRFAVDADLCLTPVDAAVAVGAVSSPPARQEIVRVAPDEVIAPAASKNRDSSGARVTPLHQPGHDRTADSAKRP